MSSVPPRPHEKNKVKQQKLPHWFPGHNSFSVAITFIIIAVFLLPMGVAIIIYSDRSRELSFRYDDVNNYTFTLGEAGELPTAFSFNGTNYTMGAKVRMHFTLTKSISAPVYLQYRLHGFHQNYRWYGASMDSSQLSGGTGSMNDNCEPYRWPGEARDNRTAGYYNPCGAVPWSLFNDTFALFKDSGDLICDGAAFDVKGNSLNSANKCVKEGIAFNSDMKKRYKAPEKSRSQSGPMWSFGGDASSDDPFLKEGYYYQEPGHPIPYPVDEDFVVWVNVAYTGDFSKSYRIINADMPSGDYYFDIVENFDLFSMNGKKYAQLVTRTWIGGRNHHLGILLVAFGGGAFIIAVAIVVMRMTAFRKPRYL